MKIISVTILNIYIFLLFLILKLTNVIDWSWLWVTAPLWLPVAVLSAFIIFSVIVIMFVGIVPHGSDEDDI